jgi:hypothetical protein
LRCGVQWPVPPPFQPRPSPPEGERAHERTRSLRASLAAFVPVKHYTQQPSQIQTSSADTALEVRGGGFVTRKMVHEALDAWRGTLPPGILVDLREVAGYESGCASLAQRWLLDAHRSGVQRIAFIASSSVLRTVTRVASSGTSVALRIFEEESTARSWLAADGVADEPPRMPASVESPVRTGP